jgi:DNA polymerase
LLDAMLAAVNKKRGDGVYIANVIKCRPPGNRNPEPAEIAACTPYLKRQIALAEPKLLLAGGKFAAQTLLNRDDTVGAMRASGGAYEGVPVVVTYHPSYLLRSPLEKAKAWEDLIKARSMVP